MPTDRRHFLQSAGLAALAGASGCSTASSKSEATAPSIYDRLGVTPVINAVGTVTILGGSIMPPEVIAAMEDASRRFVPMHELQEKASAHLAEIIGVPAAMITCGAASAITVATAACMARGDDAKLHALPDTTGMPYEVIQQKAHKDGYEAQMWLTGAKTVWVETADEMKKAISDRTAMAFFLNKGDPDGQIQRKEFLEICKEHGVPTVNDAAADVPPANRLRDYVDEGFDLVIFSGGKGLLGPQSSGLLLGREDLITAGLKAISPYGGIGRGMKVGKEEMAGLVAAVERYLRVDHDAERRELEARAKTVMDKLAASNKISAELLVPEIANNVPHVVVKWSEGDAGLTAGQAVEKLQAGSPPIWVSRTGDGELRMSMWMLRDGEAEVLGDRVAGLFA
jgi:L-seryl-tRNA(Ser) seleniumtransferase